ncbi:glycerophosphodiester phosphodiesterase family protein [Sediminitomix flava]|uniref:Glycerophosphoryl diester phosphodiesterase n=1 Tax=Sediminitomix flava TaxID=379075 RepID=A0A315ZES8_SEDFL|nr:glycerophosphodiester phosphodiesterase family protein [Sediminitomix flava]PWJ43832.1 glycerophosphoryl diester phosphodiesterase [Sediminitomix flava]
MKRSNVFLALAMSFLVFSCKTTTDKTTKQDGNSSINDTSITFTEWLKNPKPLISAHRGGPYSGYPENAIETFDHVNQFSPVVIETDISMTKDSVLVMMHDNTLERTTNGKGAVKKATYQELQKLSLVDNDGKVTSYKIPTLDEVLAWGKGKVLFTLDVKRGVPFEKVLDAVEKHNAESYAAIITYRMQDAEKVYKLNDKAMISISLGDDGAIKQFNKSGIPAKNVLAFVGTREPQKSHYAKLKELGVKTILGTLGNLDKSAVAKGNDSVYLNYVQNGADIIATDRPLEVSAVLAK